MAKYQRNGQSTIKKSETLHMQLELPMAELIAGACDSIEALCGEIGLRIMKAVMQREIELKTGRWGHQRNYRHGKQKGYVVYSGFEHLAQLEEALCESKSISKAA